MLHAGLNSYFPQPQSAQPQSSQQQLVQLDEQQPAWAEDPANAAGANAASANKEEARAINRVFMEFRFGLVWEPISRVPDR
jgi:hypothetical protein